MCILPLIAVRGPLPENLSLTVLDLSFFCTFLGVSAFFVVVVLVSVLALPLFLPFPLPLPFPPLVATLTPASIAAYVAAVSPTLRSVLFLPCLVFLSLALAFLPFPIVTGKRGSKENRKNQTRRRSHFYYGGGNFCSLNCYNDWSDQFMERAIDSVSGRITEPLILTEENAWRQVWNRAYWDDNTQPRYIERNMI